MPSPQRAHRHDAAIGGGRDVRRSASVIDSQRPVEKHEAEHAVRGFVLDDPPEHGARAADGGRRARWRAAAGSTPPRRRRRSARSCRRRAAAAAAPARRRRSCVGLELDLGAAAQLHRHARASARRAPARRDGKRDGHRDEIERRAAFEQSAQRRRAGDARCGALETRRRSTACAPASSAASGSPVVSKRAPGHRLDLGAHPAVAPLDVVAEELEFEQLGCQRGPYRGATRLATRSSGRTCRWCCRRRVGGGVGAAVLRRRHQVGHRVPPHAT